jgi:hypothetical protein
VVLYERGNGGIIGFCNGRDSVINHGHGATNLCVVIEKRLPNVTVVRLCSAISRADTCGSARDGTCGRRGKRTRSSGCGRGGRRGHGRSSTRRVGRTRRGDEYEGHCACASKRAAERCGMWVELCCDHMYGIRELAAAQCRFMGELTEFDQA